MYKNEMYCPMVKTEKNIHPDVFEKNPDIMTDKRSQSLLFYDIFDLFFYLYRKKDVKIGPYSYNLN